MNAAICDDENYWRETLTDCLAEYKKSRHIDIFIDYFSDGISLTESSEKFDMIFMDYQMNDLDGIETARRIRKSNNNCIIIFVSAFPNVALDTFEVNAFRFLAKPIDREKLFRSLDDYFQTEKSNFLILNTHNGIIKIRESDILFCESIQKHSLIHTANDSYDIPANLHEIEKKLSEGKFFRCHKSYIVSFYHIKSHNNTDIFFDNGEKAYISRRYFTPFKSAFQDYVARYNLEKY